MKVNTEEILDLLRQTGAMREGHFLLSSGLHSPRYVQCAQLLQHPEVAEKVGEGLARLVEGVAIDLVIGPALGGVVLSQEVGRALGRRALFAERAPKSFTLRRGFTISPGERALVVEDVATTGASVKEVIDLVTKEGGSVVGVGVIVDRSSQPLDLGVPCFCLAKMEVETFPPEACPLCLQGVPWEKPGSRK